MPADDAPRIRLPDDDDALFAECDFETFRARGPGGQHVNTTNSAVRLRHRPTGITVTSESSRSQHRNRQLCLDKLRSEVARRNYRPKKRRPSRPSAAARSRARRAREHHARKKRNRRPPRPDD